MRRTSCTGSLLEATSQALAPSCCMTFAAISSAAAASASSSPCNHVKLMSSIMLIHYTSFGIL